MRANKKRPKGDKSKKVYKMPGKFIRIDTGLHRLMKVKAASSSMTLKSLVEQFLAEGLGQDWKDTGTNEIE